MARRVGITMGAGVLLLLTGCAGLAPSGAGTKPGASGASASAVVTPDFSGPEVPVDLSIDQAALDEAIRKAKEFEALVARAEGGDDEAQFELAERYAHGREVQPDPEEAKRWYLRAADSGHEKSRALLVSSYIRNTMIGYEPKAEFPRLLPWIKDAAKSGDVVAQELLARKYAKGEDVPRDYYEARRWLQALADRGFMGAQYSLAVMYHQGLGVEPDPRTAYKWFEAAAKQGDGRSQYMVALLNYYGRGVSQSVRAAREWAAKAAQQDDAEIKRQAIALINALDKAGGSRPQPAPAPQPRQVPQVDKDGKPVLDQQGKPVMGPASSTEKADGQPEPKSAPPSPQGAVPAAQPAAVPRKP